MARAVRHHRQALAQAGTSGRFASTQGLGQETAPTGTQTGLTRKNEERLRQFREETVLRNLFTLPNKILTGERRKPPNSRSALRVQTSVAIALLTVAPMRIGNLRSLDRDRHFVRASFSEKDPVLQISIDSAARSRTTPTSGISRSRTT